MAKKFGDFQYPPIQWLSLLKFEKTLLVNTYIGFYFWTTKKGKIQNFIEPLKRDRICEFIFFLFFSSCCQSECLLFELRQNLNRDTELVKIHLSRKNMIQADIHNSVFFFFTIFFKFTFSKTRCCCALGTWGHSLLY